VTCFAEHRRCLAGRTSRAALCGALALAVTLGLAGVAPAAPARSKESSPSAAERSLLHSHELWATIDVCTPADQHNVVGIRGSMPGDGKSADKMYMSFRLQYLAAGKRWSDVSSGASSGWVAVGGGAQARQEGTSFDLKPVQGKPPVTLRGVVDFQWRQGTSVLYVATELTSAGHKGVADADPANFSAASCVIG
jgi:hypothetical protein